MVHAGLPACCPLWFCITAEREPLRPHPTRGHWLRAYRRPGLIAPISDAHEAASPGRRNRSAWEKPCRLAAKLRSAMMAARTPRYSRWPFAGTLSGPNREEQLVDQHPWIKSYPAGVRWDAELATMPVSQILEQSAEQWPDKPALDFMGKKLTYRELDDLANR